MDAPTELLLDVFAEVPQVMVCVKSAGGRYTAANAAFVQRARCRTEAEVLGRRAADLFEPGLAASYEADPGGSTRRASRAESATSVPAAS